ncbi:MAG: NADP-dependent phosphogluconate dehydrogenase [Saprospiraceae bacterium]|nr:NADP-dependent phosphogluconate dehydrogenase [Saprospiraceae bacterium]
MKAVFGIVGLGVMGKSLSRNMASKGFRLALFNRYVQDKEEAVAENFIREFPELEDALGFEDLASFAQSLERPRKILLMVQAGSATDQTIDALRPYLEAGDILIDGGNAFFKDTESRISDLKEAGIHFMGTGVSGGEAGALNGPSIMPGGDAAAYEKISPFLEQIAAKDINGKPCCTYIGSGGSGHFVKMVHNGIEYAEMQLIAELYALLRWGTQLNPDEIADIFEPWLSGPANSYLLEITVSILRKTEGETFLIDLILDQAANKGTGSWTSIVASDLGVAIPTITAALFARFQSAFKAERVQYASQFPMHPEMLEVDVKELLDAYQLARFLNHQQGFVLMQQAAIQFEWQLNLSELARIWTNGCIIRSQMMRDISHVFSESQLLLAHPLAWHTLDAGKEALLALVGKGLAAQIPLPCFSASANYMLMAFQEDSSANLIQAQRDFFGAHTYQRVDDPSGKKYHTNW